MPEFNRLSTVALALAEMTHNETVHSSKPVTCDREVFCLTWTTVIRVSFEYEMDTTELTVFRQYATDFAKPLVASRHSR